ncbi:MAG: RNA degradosome polyphosphate kinase [Lachnospiraceae bacterium]|jgi:polyphosphate kinase|nr:RNA degradosome polyphosphate kinase [Lachnospiraceae bacterium]
MSEKEKEKTKPDFSQPSNYINRELSWLLFNRRVLDEAKDKQNPLFERLKFLSITASNLDEFYMIRVAALKEGVEAGLVRTDMAGLTPAEQLKEINQAAHELVSQQYNIYKHALLPQLAQIGLKVVGRHEDLTKKEADYVDRYFAETIYPVLTPMAVDSSRPFPLLRNKSCNIGALIRAKAGSEETQFATVQVPGVIPRIVPLPGPAYTEAKGTPTKVILLEEIIERNIHKLFLNYDIVCAQHFRIMRDADLNIEEDETDDLLKEIERKLKRRQWGQAIRLEVEEGIDERLLKILRNELALNKEDIFLVDGPLDLTFLMKMYGLPGFEKLKETAYPAPAPLAEFVGEADMFARIRAGDVLLHHPYQDFSPVISFIMQAAADPEVLAIKQTLYRVSGNSPIIAALATAAENGKQVTVLVELKARFDEENNIVWARKLEQAGCHVIYGLVGLKTHCKITLVVRREEDGINRYVHLSTGNYNDATAKLYTDIGILSCHAALGEDATAVFNMLSGYSEPLGWNKLSLAPLWLKDRFLFLIERERDHAKAGNPARIIAKVNALCDKDIIEALYHAAYAGVEIDLIVRGICCLKVGLPGIGERLRVRSVVGNFLEHSRLFFFENDGNHEYYAGSADWMPRNLERRVEILFPIEQQDLREELNYIFATILADTVKAHILTPLGHYEKVDKRGKKAVNSQMAFARRYAGFSAAEEGPAHSRVFTPVYKAATD